MRYSQEFTQFLQELEALPGPEQKLERALAFMAFAISQQGSPHFKEFWDAKKICLDLFKEHIHPSLRVTSWARYSELCREARNLKDLLCEQSAFASEQIELAIAAMEIDLEQMQTFLERAPALERLCKAIAAQHDRYSTLQKELNLLNSYAARTTSLRKELLKTSMRIGQKNRLLHRLTAVGDKVFPRRKALMQEISQLFLADVEHFITATCAQELPTHALYAARDEIRALQRFAKVFTLTTEAFSKTRIRLSECWDNITRVTDSRKKESTKKRVVHKEKPHPPMQLQKDSDAESREKELLASGDATLDLLKEVRQARKRRLAVCKEQLERLRKAQGSSGLDFSEALHYNDLIAQERRHLAHIEETIEEIEEKIEATRKR